jgi:ribosomal protein S18 acetylase RimI-like enzyme
MKTHEPAIAIEATTDAGVMAECAAMMAASAPWTTMGIDYDQCLLAFGGAWRETYVLWYEQEVAGFVIIQPYGTFKGYIQTICISERHRGKGLGKKLLRFCEEKILETSPNIFICVSDFNERAIKLYLEFGFEPVGELPDFVKEGFREILLRKTVGPIMGYRHHDFNPTHHV